MFENEKLKNYKCWKCLYRGNDPLNFPLLTPCDVCKDRPNRNKDKSEFYPDLTDEEKAEIRKNEIKIEQRQGKYQY